MSEIKHRHLRILETKQKRTGFCSEYARIGQEIEIDAQVLAGLADGKYRPIHYDLLIVCAAIEYADRRWPRNDLWSRNLRLTIPVTELAIWQNQEVSRNLIHVLRHLTCDTWQFDFEQAIEYPRPTGQTRISFPDPKSFAIAYSEGLDSRAVWALSGTANESICIRVTKKNYNKAKEGDSLFTQIPFSVVLSNGRESSFRSRAFQFAAITSIAAQIAEINRIVVPESGQGVLSPAMLPPHRVYADYRNYPTFFRKMETFIHLLLGHQVKFEQSRLWSTKGETMCDFLKLPGKTPEYLIETRSCWQIRNVVNLNKKRRQCGLCAACILRRFSLQRAGVEEPADTYIVHDLTVPNAKDSLSAVPERFVQSMLSYGISGVRHFQQFAKMATYSDKALKLYSMELSVATSAPENETLENLKSLLNAHAEEWREFIVCQGKKSFLLGWINGDN